MRIGEQLLRFMLVGGVSAVIDYSLTMLTQHGLGWDNFLAKAIGFIVGTTVAYLINRRWTFAGGGSVHQGLKVAALYVVTFSIQEAFYILISRNFPDTIMVSTIAFVIAQGAATTVNFMVQRWFIFAVPPNDIEISS